MDLTGIGTRTYDLLIDGEEYRSQEVVFANE